MTKGRILQTGFTTQHCGRGTRFKYDPVAKLFADALRHYGYEVDHRPAQPDEDLTQYDAVFSGLGPVNGLAARYTYGGLDAIARAKQSGAAIVFYIDDWQTQLVKSAAGTMVKEPSRLAKPFLRGARDIPQWEWAQEPAHLDRMIGVCDAFVNHTWPTTVMALYDGGDWNLFKDKVPTEKLVGVDGTPFYSDYDITIPPDSDRWGAWVFGVLSDQRKWLDSLNLQWPLAHRGGKASKSDDGGMPEPELVQMYANSWGVLSSPYWHAGSGWLRIRHHHSALTGSILVSESKELGFISSAYEVKANDVERLSIPQLRELANHQSEAWFKRLPTRDEMAERIGAAMAEEIAKMK